MYLQLNEDYKVKTTFSKTSVNLTEEIGHYGQKLIRGGANDCMLRSFF